KMSLQNVTLASATPNNQSALIFWTNPGSACFDEVLVVANLTAGIDFTPTGDGSAYTPNPVWAGNNSIVYKADFNTNSVDVSGLTNGTPYYFEIFVRKGTLWSSGVEVTTTPTNATPFLQGDIAIVAVNTQYLSSGSDDEVCFFAFKDIEEGTSIEFTDNGYERATAGLWGDTEGTIRIQRTDGGTIPAGTVICLRGAGNKASDFTIMNCGVNDNANWTIVSLNGNLYSFDLNVSDQIWIFQNGAWSNPPGSHNATYTGNVVWGWTATGWQTAPGYNSTAGSTRPVETECFTLDLNGIPNKDKVKYTGPMTAASQVTWLQRIATVSNWTGYSSNANYNSGGPNYGSSCVTMNISSTGFTAGLWSGFTSTDWFNCRNWDNLKVPDQNVDVTIPNVTNKPVIGSGVANTKDITIQSGSNLTMNNTASELRVHGNWVNNSGSALNLTANTNATVRFRGGITQSIGGSSSTNFQRLIIENSSLVNLTTNAQIGGNGLLEVTGTGSQLGCTATSELNIQGNSTFRLISGGAMNNSCLDNLTFITGGNSSTATFTGNGNAIKAYNFNSVKATSGGLTLSANTPFEVKNNFTINYAPGTAQLVDNDNTLTIGDDLRLKGTASNFNLTGTIVLTCANSGTGQADIEVESGNTTDAIQAHLNNLTINSSNNDANVRFQGQTGNNTITIKNHFTIQSMGAGREIRLHENTLRVGGNWDNQVGQTAFNEGTSIVEFNGAALQSISAVGGEIFYRLRSNNTAGIQLNNNVQAFEELIMTTGNITTGTNTLTIGSSSSQTGTLTRVSGRVIGTMRRWFAPSVNVGDASGLFPLGNAMHDQFVKVEYTTAPTAGGTLTARFKAEDMALFGFNPSTVMIPSVGSCASFMIETLSSEGYWEITDGNGLTAGNYDITLTAEGFSNINDLCQISAVKRVGTGNWMESGDHQEVLGTVSRPEVKRSNATGWSNWGFGGGALNPLPVQLIHFNADNIRDEFVQLSWTTASEMNNDYFVIERSPDAQTFSPILTTEGAGNSNQVIGYKEYDFEPHIGISYYRLKQVDFDGQFSYSDIIPVNFRETKFDVMLWGNANNSEKGLIHLNNAQNDVMVTIYDASGRLLSQQIISKRDTESLQTLNFSHLKQGMYVIRFISDDKIITKRWVR
ncbi:MAG: T9SS type A sorting domain-containing protein, partial [Flavobacteriales bacterium]